MTSRLPARITLVANDVDITGHGCGRDRLVGHLDRPDPKRHPAKAETHPTHAASAVEP